MYTQVTLEGTKLNKLEGVMACGKCVIMEVTPLV